MMRYFLICLLVLGGLTAAHAQTWSQKLSAAERDFEDGRLQNIPERLQGGFELKTKEGGFTHEERIRAYKLITKVYIFIDDEPKAEEYLVYLLKTDKEHKLNPQVDPAELYFLYEKFQSKPIFRLALRAGVNKSYPNRITAFGTGNTYNINKVYNGGSNGPNEKASGGTLGLGYWAELIGERHIRWGIEGGFGAQYRLTQYDVDNFVSTADDQSPAINTVVRHQSAFLRLPLSVRYNFRYFSESGPIPYVTAGTSYDYLISAEYVEASREGGTQYVLTSQGSDLKALEMVNYHNWSFFGAVGAKFRVQTHFITLEARYDKGMINYINAQNRYSGNQYMTYDLGIVEDDLALDALSFSIGYTYSIYNPQKLKQFR